MIPFGVAASVGCLLLFTAAWIFVSKLQWPGWMSVAIAAAGLVLFATDVARTPLDAEDLITWMGALLLVACTLMSSAFLLNVRNARKVGAPYMHPALPWRWTGVASIVLFLVAIPLVLKARSSLLSLAALLQFTHGVAQSFLGGARLGERGVAYYSFSPWEDIVSWQLTEFLRRVEVRLRLRGDPPRMMAFQVVRSAREPLERLLRDKLGPPGS